MFAPLFAKTATFNHSVQRTCPELHDGCSVVAELESLGIFTLPLKCGAAATTAVRRPRRFLRYGRCFGVQWSSFQSRSSGSHSSLRCSTASSCFAFGSSPMPSFASVFLPLSASAAFSFILQLDGSFSVVSPATLHRIKRPTLAEEVFCYHSSCFR
jgi:hypothetical protein